MGFFSEGIVEEYEAFLEKYSLILHPNHFHMVTAKHSLCQMLGRTEGCLIQDMPLEMVCNSVSKAASVINSMYLQGGWGGWPTGSGKKLSNSQAGCLAQLCLVAA